MQYLTIPVTAYQQNCSLIWCENTLSAAFVDPGGDVNQLIHAAEIENVTVDKVILTHGHLDHVGGALEVAKEFNVPIIGPHRDDAFWFEWLPQQAEMFGFPAAKAFSPDQWLNEGDTVQVGDFILQVYLCPGHTPGHIVLYENNTQTLFAGDILFKGSVGRSDFPRGNHNDLINSIKHKLFPMGDGVTVVPGHGPNTTIGEERLNNPFLN